ncbi:MAG: hypothetical protein JWQ85_2273 [Mucilaginibacter sp.]|nr:hypothetical protein [Mucilaginibacter sp.]MDB5128041.1 hypothetical protein [Mucilaginibacter sp.]
MKAFERHFLIVIVCNFLVVHQVDNSADKEKAGGKKIKHPHCYLANGKAMYARDTNKAKQRKQ